MAAHDLVAPSRLGLTLALVASVALAGCGDASGSPGPTPTVSPGPERSTAPAVPDGFVDESGLVPEAEAALATFEGRFPGGYVMPDFHEIAGQVSAHGEKDSAVPVTYEEGVGRGFVLSAWQCAWEYELAEGLADDTSSQIDEAVAELQTFYDLELTKEIVIDPERAWYANVIERALQGDESELRAEVQRCGAFLPAGARDFAGKG